MTDNMNSFISLWEKDVVLLKNKGNSFEAIATKYNISPLEVRRTYAETVDKLNLLVRETEVSKQIFPCKTIAEFLDQLGISSKLVGRKELTDIIRLSYLYPEAVDNIAKELIPVLAKLYDCSEAFVYGRVCSAVRQAYSHSREIGTPAHTFFEMADLKNRRTTNLKLFLLASHDCITELLYMIPAHQKKLYML